MDKHTCATSFSFVLDCDIDLVRKNGGFTKCSAEQAGILNKDEAEQAIASTLGVTPVYRFGRLEIGRNEDYNVYVSDMIRVTLRDLFGKESQIVELKKRYNLTSYLLIVPYVVADSEQPKQCLSLDDDIIAFLYKTGTSMDLDYYVI